MLFTSRCVAAWGLALCLIGAGCAPKAVEPLTLDARYDAVSPKLAGHFARIRSGGERNAVLTWEEAGLAALQLGDRDTARSAFDEALLRIESVFSDTETAQEARSLWFAESVKDFKGEPYERAMAYFYRGLIDMWDGDYENARAMFKSGLQQDAFAEEEQYRADFALLMFMSAWCSHMLGDYAMADEDFARTMEFRPDFVPPERDHNALVILETGSAPRKAGRGPGMSELVFKRGMVQQARKAQVQGVRAYPMEDIYWQASTRGGRLVDSIIQGKARFKSINETMGKTMTQVGTAAMVAGSHKDAPEGMKYAGAAMALLGITQMAVAANVDARADTRYWRNLPDTVHVLTMHADCAGELPIRFLDNGGTPVPLTPDKVLLMQAGNGYLGRATSNSAILY